MLVSKSSPVKGMQDILPKIFHPNGPESSLRKDPHRG